MLNNIKENFCDFYIDILLILTTWSRKFFFKVNKYIYKVRVLRSTILTCYKAVLCSLEREITN